MSIRLGIYDGHNASAVLFKDGSPIRAIQEERLTRVKNHYGFPSNAIKKIIELSNLVPPQIDAVCMASRYVEGQKKPHSMSEDFEYRYNQPILRRVRNKIAYIDQYGKLRAKMRMEERKNIAVSMGFRPENIRYFDHHEAHAASAYYGLKKDDAPYLVITVDGAGDGLASTVWVAKNGRMERIASSGKAHSLGEIYAVTTHYMGFVPLEHEYKLMGMAPYSSERAAEEICGIYDRYLDLHIDNPLEFQSKVPEPLAMIGPRLEVDLRRRRFDSICAGLQLFTERILCRWVQACVRKTGIRRVLAAGGVFMNVKANKKMAELGEVEYFEAFPSSGDESLPFGSCYMSCAQDGEKTVPLTHYYFGNDLSPDECAAAVKNTKGFEVEEPSDMADRAADLLAQGVIVARASGPMEFGARALGNRSILGDPINQDLVRVINRMIKKRDFWMPFAPVVLKDESLRYFVNPKSMPSPYMMQTFDTTEERKKFMAAVHNADLTARPQIVERGQNPGYEGILDAFKKKTGRGVLLNTSFNLHGFPIVCSPEDALKVFAESGLECLVLGPYVLRKKG